MRQYCTKLIAKKPAFCLSVIGNSDTSSPKSSFMKRTRFQKSKSLIFSMKVPLVLSFFVHVIRRISCTFSGLLLYNGIDVSKDKHDICIKSNDGNVLKHYRLVHESQAIDHHCEGCIKDRECCRRGCIGRRDSYCGFGMTKIPTRS